MSKYNLKNSNSDHLNIPLLKRLEVYSEKYLEGLKKYWATIEDSLLIKRLYKDI